MKCSLVVFSILAATLASPLPASDILLQPVEEMGDYFEGDMILTESQRRAFFDSRIDSRTGLLNERFRWKDNTLAYDFADDVNQEQRDYIELALRNISSNTCLTFTERTTEVDYVIVSTDSSGCSSHVGRKGGLQTLYLMSGKLGEGCFRFGTVMHEFIHALGFFHTQSAYNRDEYVLIKWENIEEDMKHNFEKHNNQTTTMFDLDYDYGSVMHYGSKGFSTNGEDTIVPLKEGVVIGQREKMSDLDIRRLNKMYNCPNEQ